MNDKVEFQHTAARRRLGQYRRVQRVCFRVSTHSRPKAAGTMDGYAACEGDVSTHSRPKAAGRYLENQRQKRNGFNTQPPEGGWTTTRQSLLASNKFQHTAARRRLDQQLPADRRDYGFNTQPPEGGWRQQLLLENSPAVSTHSRPKAAGLADNAATVIVGVSTHSRPKAAGPTASASAPTLSLFQHTAARRRLVQNHSPG